MHELSIAEELLDIIHKYAEDAGISKISCINLRIGEFSGIFPDSLEFAFEVLSEGKITENADLKIEKVSAKYVCRNCGFSTCEYSECCKNCGLEEMSIEGGAELEIVSFEGE